MRYGFASPPGGLRMIAGLCSGFGDGLHPQPEGSDQEARLARLAWLDSTLAEDVYKRQEKECGTARRGDSGFGTSDKAVQRGGEAVHAFPYAVSGPSGHGRPRSADGHEPSERRVQRIAPDADFRRKMPCEARQAGSVLKPGDEKAHGRVAEPIRDGQQPLAHERCV